MQVVASELIAADLATELELRPGEANQYLDSLSARDEEEWAGELDESRFPALTIRD